VRPVHGTTIVVERHATAIALDEVSDLLDRAIVLDDERPLSEGKWLDLVHGGRHGFAAAVAHRDGGPMVGYAQATRGYEGWGLEVVTDPAADPDGRLCLSLVEAMVTELRPDGERVHYWVNRPDSDSDGRLAPLGLTPDRELLEMRVPLPLAAPRVGRPLEVRSFRPETDDLAWLRINNRAFADHPEQGGWDLGTLRDRQAEPWFDPAGFLIHEIDGRMAGSCWTKVHDDTNPPMGEIYVISVDPDFQGRGLGRGLTVAGLEWLAREGLTVGMLFTTASNVVAVKLYRSLGFVVHRTQRVYTTSPT
jgi:mycothiol synthase